MPRDAIAHNRAAHDRHADVYDASHPEIFNPVEQARLEAALARAVREVADSPAVVRALDVGCGSGNLTRHLLALGARVTAADLSTRLLDVTRRRFAGTGRLETMTLNGTDLRPVPDATFDLVAAYSVLHHVPDYVALVTEMARVTRPGGIVFFDHERSDESWVSASYRQFLREAVIWPRRRWWYWLQPHRYLKRLRAWFAWRSWLDPRWMPEGDLHIWPDDHIEWARIEGALASAACTVVVREDYLAYEPRYQQSAWESWRERASDMRLLIARKDG
ncbi:MAG: class I SAM-dependent methyltransferase [Gemmatimonadetes bacterium]|nr:class I SAM-dependent methyltransferase [Gemmatimonadota bacterium]